MKAYFTDEGKAEERELMDKPVSGYFSAIFRRISKIKCSSPGASFYFRKNLICETDYEGAAEYHISSGADVTLVYIEGFPESPFYIGICPPENAERKSVLTLKGYVCNIQDAESVSEFCMRMLEGKSSFTPSGRRKSGVIMGKDVRLTVGAKIIPPVYLGSGAVIEDNTEIERGSVIGSGSVISRGSRIRGGIIGRGCFVGQNSTVSKGAVIESCCYIGKGINVKKGVTVKGGERIESGMVSSFGTPGSLNHLKAAETGFLYCCLKGRGRIAVGFSGSPFGEMQKSGIISGIMSAGGEAVDMGMLPLFAFRDGIMGYSASGGIYINEEEYTKPLFFGRRGTGEEAPEPSRGSWAQVNSYFVKPLIQAKNIDEIYSLKVASRLEKAKENTFIFFTGGSDRVKAHLKLLGEKCGITAVEIKEKSIRPGALRVNFKNDGEISEIYNKEGEILSEDEYYLAIAKACLKAGENKVLVPSGENITLPDKLMRIRERGEELIKAVTQEGIEEERIMLTDGCYAAMRLAME